MSEYEEYQEFVKTNERSIRQWFADIKNTDVFLYFNSKDNKPFYYFLRRVIGRKLIRTIGLKKENEKN